jgi:hypothetical protein
MALICGALFRSRVGQSGDGLGYLQAEVGTQRLRIRAFRRDRSRNGRQPVCVNVAMSDPT